MDQNKLNALLTLLDDENEEIRKQVEDELLVLGKDAVPTLESFWEQTSDTNVQEQIEHLIHSIQFRHLKDALVEWKENRQENLLEGIWLIATYQHPDLRFDSLKAQIDQIFYEAWMEEKNYLHPYDEVKILNRVLFKKLGFKGNTRNFHAPSNSMINHVLQYRKGNPISLCIVYMLIAQKLNMPVYGVNLPNLFILTYKSDQMQFYINAFNKGLIFTREDVDNYVENLNMSPQEVFYQPCSNVDIIKRVIRNLMIAFDKKKQQNKIKELNTLLNCLAG